MLSERVGAGDWISKFESIRHAMQEGSRLKIEQQEKLELLSRRVELGEQVQEEIKDLLLSWSNSPRAAELPAGGATPARSSARVPGVLAHAGACESHAMSYSAW